MNNTASKGGVGSTLRHALREELLDGFSTSRDLSSRLGVPEKDIAHHLEHLDRTLRGSGARLEIEPATCVACGFIFKKRERLTRPSSCPLCASGRIEPPRFRVTGSPTSAKLDRPSAPRIKKGHHRGMRVDRFDDDAGDAWFYEQKFAS